MARGTTTTTEQAQGAERDIAMTRKTTTAADIAAAVALGALPESTPILTPEQAAEQAEQAARAAVADALAVETARQARATAERATTTTPESTAEHHCTQAGCRHGAHTTGQPDRQVKLVAPCGAILRMTPRALLRAGGVVTCGHGDPFAIDATRRQYRRATAEQA